MNMSAALRYLFGALEKAQNACARTREMVKRAIGRFLDMAFDQLRGSLRLESDGSFTVLDGSGDPLLDSETGKRVEPSVFLSRHKADEFLGFAFEPEQGYGGGAFPAGPGRRDTGNPINDLKGLSTDEIFARTFGRR
jgi:hypothetical protein